jgi:hypothetical protein
MLIAAATEWILGIPAERRSLEDVASPLSSEGTLRAYRGQADPDSPVL